MDLVPFTNQAEDMPDDELTTCLYEWVQAKYDRSGSERTKTEYGRVMHRLRRDLRLNGLDLDSPPHAVARFVQEWLRIPRRASQKTPKPSSRKQRLSTISSFYQYAIRHDVLATNPIAYIEYPRVHQYEGAVPIDKRTVMRVIQAINPAVPLDRRDLALLLAAFTTGRRAAELAGMTIRDLAPYINDQHQDTLQVRWRVKGGATSAEPLEQPAAQALVIWLTSWYGHEWPKLLDAPVWTRVDGHDRQIGNRLGYQGIRLVFMRRFGPLHTRVHVSRHSFALMFLNHGGDLLELMERLGHKSLTTTQIYAQAMKQFREGNRTLIGDLRAETPAPPAEDQA